MMMEVILLMLDYLILQQQQVLTTSQLAHITVAIMEIQDPMSYQLHK